MEVAVRQQSLFLLLEDDAFSRMLFFLSFFRFCLAYILIK